jgi:hypothetical protein
MGWEQLHVFPLAKINSFCRWIDIVFTKDGIHTLIDVVIVDPTCANLLSWFWTIQRFVVSNEAQTKEKSYYEQHPTNQFLLLAIEVFGCLHKQINVFLHNCANAIWNFKGTKGPLLSIYLGFCFRQKFQLHYKGWKHPPS